jgi:hypothetical protein
LLLNVPDPEIHVKRAVDMDWPVYTSIPDFESRAGSKMKALIKLINHLCSHDQAPPPIVDPDHNDQMKFPALPAVPQGEQAPRRNKTLVSFNFAAITPTLVSVSFYIL